MGSRMSTEHGTRSHTAAVRLFSDSDRRCCSRSVARRPVRPQHYGPPRVPDRVWCISICRIPACIPGRGRMAQRRNGAAMFDRSQQRAGAVQA